MARKRLSYYPEVTVCASSFEDREPEGRKFNLVYAATSWHWIDPNIRFSKAARILKPGGHVAFWSASHAFPDGFDSFFTEIQDVYDAIGDSYWRQSSGHESEPAKGTWPPPPPEEVPDEAEATEKSALLDTFSGHRAMSDDKREFLYREVRGRIKQKPNGKVLRHWHSILHVAKLKQDQA